ncbi:MAG: response regulator [Pseudomonadota bacterium]|jgi:CheY-like chemotaxis protein|nr:response regulator [Pseudomonadota bacterium]
MAYNFNSVTVLVVDDNIPMLQITKSLLLTFGVGNVLTAKDGEAAFELFQRYDPDLIITDWMMRPMDGIALAKKIRRDKTAKNPYVPIILMTGFSEKHRIFEARDEGITEILVKPFKARDLYKRLFQIIEKPRQFVRSEDFFGPDRRRRNNGEYQGPRRRQEDVAKMFPEGRVEMSHATKKDLENARKHLEEVRNKAGIDENEEITITDYNIEVDFVEAKDDDDNNNE